MEVHAKASAKLYFLGHKPVAKKYEALEALTCAVAESPEKAMTLYNQ